MAQITLKGNPFNTVGDLPPVGSAAPAFIVTSNKLADVSLAQYSGKKVILNIFPSIDTPVCATSVRKFNEQASKLENTVILCVSADLPFAQSRFCGAEGIENVESVSTFRSSFGQDYGVTIVNGPLAGLLSRAIVILDSVGQVVYTQQVSEIADEPDYETALQYVS
jgi:thiol peroxidase